MASNYAERGQTRSGRRFAKANFGHFSSLNELLSRHEKLLVPFAQPSTRYFEIGVNQGSLMQTTIHFSADFTKIKQKLLRTFLELFAEHTEEFNSGFEVLVTFNAVLSNPEGTSFSVFYGHDYRAGNLLGASPELRYGDPYIVRTLGDVAQLPTVFNFEELAHAHRYAFQHSGVRIARFLNVVYLVYRFIPPPPLQRRRRRRQLDEGGSSEILEGVVHQKRSSKK